MKTFLLNIPNEIRSWNNSLDAKALLCSQSWNVFNDEGIIIDTKTDKGSKHAEYAYDKFISAAEKEGFFLMNISIAGYVACNAEDFIEGTPDELRALLRTKLGGKFKEK